MNCCSSYFSWQLHFHCYIRLTCRSLPALQIVDNGPSNVIKFRWNLPVVGTLANGQGTWEAAMGAVRMKCANDSFLQELLTEYIKCSFHAASFLLKCHSLYITTPPWKSSTRLFADLFPPGHLGGSNVFWVALLWMNALMLCLFVPSCRVVLLRFPLGIQRMYCQMQESKLFTLELVEVFRFHDPA